MALASLWQHPPTPSHSSLLSPLPFNHLLPPIRLVIPPFSSLLLGYIVPPPICLTPVLHFLTSVLLVATFCPSSLLSPHSLECINHLSFS